MVHTSGIDGNFDQLFILTGFLGLVGESHSLGRLPQHSRGISSREGDF